MARLTALNFGVQTVWGAILAVSLQARVSEFAPGSAPQTYALFAAAGALIATIVQIVCGRWSDARRLATGHRREFLIAGCVLATAALYGFFFAISLLTLAIALALLQIGMNVASAPFAAFVPDYVTPERSGAASSWLSIHASLGNTIGLILAGFVRAPIVLASALAVALLASLAATIDRSRSLVPIPAESEAQPQWRPLLVLLFSRGAINVGFYIVMGFLFFFVSESLGEMNPDAQRTQTAILFLVFTLAGIIGAWASAQPVDRADKRFVVTVTMGVLAGAVLALACAQSLTAGALAAAVAGIAWGAFVTADWALACTILPRGAMATSMGIWNIATAIPQVIAPLIAAPVVAYANGIHDGFGPRVAMGMAAPLFAIGAAIVWRLPRPR